MPISESDIQSRLTANQRNQIRLDLSNQLIADDDIPLILSCTKKLEVYSLDLSKNNITNIGIISLIQDLPACIRLVDLDLSHNRFSVDGAMALGCYLKENDTLKHLKLSGNPILNRGVAGILMGLTMNQTYTHEFQCKYELIRYPFDAQVNV